MAPSAIVSAEYANHDDTATFVTYDDDEVKYVMMNSNSKHKRDLDAWVAEGNEIAPCPLPPGSTMDLVSQRITSLEERVAETEVRVAKFEASL